jgi:hypothetical protein
MICVSMYSSAQGTCLVPTGIYVSSITTKTASINWSVSSGDSTYRIRYRISGNLSWIVKTTPFTTKILNTLSSGTLYEFQVKSVCHGNFSSAFSNVMFFSTLPVCSVPSGLQANQVSASSANIKWDTVTNATSYNLQYRKTGIGNWKNINSQNTSQIISLLTASTSYEYKVQSICSFGNSSYSAKGNFTTLPVIPVPDHVVIAILENHGYSQVAGSIAAPYINGYINDTSTALFVQSFALTHPSQPNYLQLYSGCDQGVTDNNIPSASPFTTSNLGRQLIDSGKTFISYSEDLPYAGFNGATWGTYARKHNPVTNWIGTGTNQIASNANQPFSAFPQGNYSQLPTVCFVIPNQDNDMHNGSDNTRITTADSWIHNNLDGYIQWCKTNNSLFILHFDEDDGNYGNHVLTFFTGQMVQGGSYTNSINHYTILRTIEEMYRLPFACNAALETPVINCWKTASHIPAADNNLHVDYLVNPNPSNREINIIGKGIIEHLELINSMGVKFTDEKLNAYFKILDISSLPRGIYFLRINGTEIKKVVIQD